MGNGKLTIGLQGLARGAGKALGLAPQTSGYAGFRGEIYGLTP